MAYPTSNPVVVDEMGIRISALTSLTETADVEGDDAIRYALEIDGDLYWWDGAAWAESDGTYAETNTIAEINSNAGSLPLASGGSIVRLHAYLHSDTGATTPELESIRWDYTPATARRLCIVSGAIVDANGPVSGAAIRAVPSPDEMSAGELSLGAVDETFSGSDGRWSLDLFETETVDKTITITISYTGASGVVSKVYSGVEIPDEATADFRDLVA